MFLPSDKICFRASITFLAFGIFSEFCSMVRKIFIYTHEEVRRLSSKAELLTNSEVKSVKFSVADADGVQSSMDNTSGYDAD